ncbi:hypothetical protein K4F52_003382 [Lecanicillium sp. MT-2017a]|nr:hypothetical protein K4F52_003382 [Lecanicillium sp. MT-2017a]
MSSEAQDDTAAQAAADRRRANQVYARLAPAQQDIIDEAMRHANLGDMKTAVDTFVSRRNKVGEDVMPLTYMILAQHDNNPEKLRQMMLAFCWRPYFH